MGWGTRKGVFACEFMGARSPSPCENMLSNKDSTLTKIQWSLSP